MPNQVNIAPMDFPLFMGREEDFDLVYRTYHQPLCYYGSKFVAADDANDLVENLFVKLWQKAPEMTSEAHVRNYLYLTLRNSCLDHLKLKVTEARRYERVMSETELTEESHLQTMISAEVLAEVYRAIHNLPLQCAKVISMSYMEGRTNAEIAKALDLSEQTVKNHKGRGLKILRENLSGEVLLLWLLISAVK